MLVPGLILVCLFLLIPLGIMISISFYRELSAAEFILSTFTFDNYVKFVTAPSTLPILINTFGTAFLTCFLCFILGFPFAYVLTFYIKNEKLKGYLISALMAPFLIDWNIRTIAWIPVLGEEGIINQFLLSLGVIHTPLEILFGQVGVYIIWLQTFVLFMVFPIYLAMNRIDADLIDAAKVLHASPHKVFYHIIFKLSLPGVITGWIFVFVSAVGDYITPGLWGGGITTLGLSISGFANYYLWPYASGLSTILLVIAIAVLYLLIKIVNIKKLVYED